MKIAIFGAGAIGGFLGAKLAAAGAADISFIARGPHLAAMRADGLKVTSAEGDIHVRPVCTDNPADLPPQDYVFLTVKAPGLFAAAKSIQPLLGPETVLVAGVNGIPWWYFHGVGGDLEGHRVKSVDPDGFLWDALPPTRTLGCIVYPAAEVTAPGVIAHEYGDRFSLGEPDGSRSPRAEALSKAMIAAGLKAPVRPRLRDELWVKLWGNMAFNPISALTGATLDLVTGDPETRDLARNLMLEGQAVAEALGIRFAIDVDKRIAGAAEVGAHKTSMLQDLERGRPMEIDALLGSVVELAELVKIPAPTATAVLALVRQRARVAGCYP
jgi:2-dehydropantoate 2-reductase